MSPDTDALNADAFIVNVAVWAEAELVDVEVLSLTDDLLELGGKIANYRIIVGRGIVTLYGCRMDSRAGNGRQTLCQPAIKAIAGGSRRNAEDPLPGLGSGRISLRKNHQHWIVARITHPSLDQC